MIKDEFENRIHEWMANDESIEQLAESLSGFVVDLYGPPF